MSMKIWSVLVMGVAVGGAAPRGAGAGLPTCDIVAVSGSGGHGHAVTARGDVLAWGSNGLGQFGNGFTGPWSDVPVPTISLRDAGVVQVEAANGGNFSAALLADGTVWGWGRGDAGQLGNGELPFSVSWPVQAIGLDSVTAIAAGSGHMLAIRSDRTVWVWGGGAIGLGRTVPIRSTPTQLTALSDVVAIAAGPGHSLAALGDGSLWTWGWNEWGQLGHGDPVPPYTVWEPQQVMALAGVRIVRMAGGERHSLAIDDNGDLWAWGHNLGGQLGDGTFDSRFTPVRVAGLSNVAQVTAGRVFSLAVDAAGEVWSWGNGSQGVLGTGDTGLVNLPTSVSTLNNAVGVDASERIAFAWLADGTAFAWGAGALGIGPTGTYFPNPILVDTRPPDQGNVLRAAKQGPDDVRLDLAAGLSLWWRVYADGDKRSLAATPLVDVDVPEVIDAGAVSRPSDVYYAFRGLSSCSLTEGPVNCQPAGGFCTEHWECCSGLCRLIRQECQ